ncbi:MAG: hypothetical protein R6V44_19000 [Paracoccaceae bacterium]
MAEGEGARGDGIDAAPVSAPRPGAGAAFGMSLAVGLGWLAGGAALGWGLGLLPQAWTPAGLWPRFGAGLALTAPVAGGLFWAALATRIEALGRRVDAFRAEAARAAATPPPEQAELSRAVANAARDALDRERGAIARQIAELGQTQRRLDAAVTSLAARPAEEADAEAAPVPDAAPAERGGRGAIPASPPRAPPEDAAQGALPLAAETESSEPAFDWEIVARALDFPRDAHDEAGFEALAAATRDRPTAELLQAAEDALTLLAQHGLYMEDLEVRHAPVSAWRRFAEGERGPTVRAVGGVESEAAVTESRALLKADPVFRDTVMHLMRRYDALLRRAATSPRGESVMLAMADSRTGRAFMLAAQAVGAFD